MTNFEYYKETILEITNKGIDFGLFHNKPIACPEVGCDKCSLKEENCSREVFKWLYAEYEEHVEQPKLTKKERQFCELVETGWFARCKNGDLCIYSEKPTKLTNCWFSNYKTYSNITLFNLPFTFITWEDEEPWSIEDLLKLEVEE